ncbi:MAG TPA: hypothetical protein VMV44_08955 [Rectinemataceae bacterium]|nr:hypothetical protein [Rectinemataceae bacterium]
MRTLPSAAGATGIQAFDEDDPETGITAEERREISAAIDEVSKANRIASSASRIEVVARKRGILLPLVVNIAAIVLTAAILLILAISFRAADKATIAQGTSIASAEGKLLQELKRESDAQLQEKDKSIADIQSKMLTIDKQRNDLASTMDQRIKTREAELQAQLQQELQQERTRLQAQGLTEDSIKSRLKALEDQKNQEFKRQLDSFKTQAEAERVAADLNYQKLKDEYAKNMSVLGDERKQILDAAKAKEDQLRSTMDARTKELEAQGSQARAALDQAKAELARLQTQRDAAQAAEDRIVGLYSSIRQAFQDRRFDAAAQAADALAGYLNDPSVATLSALQARRPLDLFVAQTLASEARTEIRNASVDTGRLLDQARLLGEARDAAQAAVAARKSGDLAQADAKYLEALQKVPEILAAHEWFMQKASDAEAARQLKLTQALDAADVAWNAGDGATALARYTEALAALPLAEGQRNLLLQRVGRFAVSEADRLHTQTDSAASAADNRSAAAALQAGSRSLSSGKWNEAIGSYLTVLSTWPKADAAPAALDGIRQAGAGLDRSMAEIVATASRDKAASDAKSAALADSLAKSAAEADRVTKQNSLLSSRISELQAKVETMAKENARLAAALPSLPQGAVNSAASLDIVELGRQVEDLRKLERRWIGITEAYGGFIVDATLAKGDTTAELASLRAFLSDERVRGTFGLLGSTLDHVLSTWDQQSSSDAIHNASFIAVQAAAMKDKQTRDRYLSGQATIFASDPFVSSFIGALRSTWQ